MKSKSKITKTIEENEEKNLLVSYCHFIYNLIGRKLLKNKKFKSFYNKSIYNSKYESILKKANMKLIPDEYFVTIYLSIIFLLGFFIISSIIFLFIDTFISVSLFYGGILFVSVVGIYLYNYPVVIANRRGNEIDAAIPYLLPYMKILAKEINFSKIVSIIDDFLIYKEIRHEFKKIKYYSGFIGYDIHSSIREAMQSCPSKNLADLMNDLVTISNSGGNIYKYLDRKLENLNQEIEAIEKKNLDTLLIFSQIYVVLLLIAPLFFTIMSSILNLVSVSTDGGAAASSSSDTVGNIIGLLLFLPLLYIGFMMLIYYSKPLYSRLKVSSK